MCEPLGTDHADLHLVVQLVSHTRFEGQRICAKRVESEIQRPRGTQGQTEVVQILPLQFREAPCRGRADLDQSHDELRGEADRATPLPRRLRARLQELIRPNGWRPGLLDQEELLFESGATSCHVPAILRYLLRFPNGSPTFRLKIHELYSPR